MKVYRITVDSAARQTGHEFDFEWDLSGVSSARDLKGKTWVAAVEWCDVMRYSEESPTYASNSLHPSALFLICPALTQHNTWQSWKGTPSDTICTLPGYVSPGFYGLSGDQPYVRKSAMGAIVQDDWLNQAGSLRFRVMRDGDDDEFAVRPCLPVGPAAYGADFMFSFMFWQVSHLGPEQPISPTYDFFKVYILSYD